MFCQPTCLTKKIPGQFNQEAYRRIEKDTLAQYNQKRNLYGASKDKKSNIYEELINLVVN